MIKKVKPSIAIFGGSFDPPHRGHQAIVSQALKSLDIDKLLVVPAYLNPFKTSSLAPATLRLKWCQTLFGTIKRVEVDDYEIREGKSTTTSQSVKHFKQYYNVKYLIIGADNLKSLTKWHNFTWLNEELTWVIITREGNPLETDRLKSWILLKIDTSISSSEIRHTKELKDVDRSIRDSVKKTIEGE